jgi:hypothetical protein
MATNDQPNRPSPLRSLLAGGVWLGTAVAGLFAWGKGGPGRVTDLKHEDIHFEESDIGVRGVLYTGFGILVSVWVITALLYFLFSYFSNLRAEQSPPELPIAAHGLPLPPEPRLQADPARDLQQVRAQAEYSLHHYAWIDRNRGTVAIPIGRAMELLAQRGIPPQTAPPNMFFEPRVGSRLTGLEGKVEPEIR